MTGFWAAPGRGGGWECSPLISEPNPVPKKKRESRFARAIRHSSANAVDTLEIGPTIPPSAWRRF